MGRFDNSVGVVVLWDDTVVMYIFSPLIFDIVYVGTGIYLNIMFSNNTTFHHAMPLLFFV